MKRPVSLVYSMAILICLILSACTDVKMFMPTATLSATATLLPTLTPTPTITPTPAPQEMSIEDMVENCSDLDARQAPITLIGTVLLPKGTVYGYEGYYGLDFIAKIKIRALFKVGNGLNQIEKFPRDFQEQDVLIRAFDGRFIRHGHVIQVTGRAVYRAENDKRKCELYVDKVVSLMPQDVLEPVSLQINHVGCIDLENSRQFIRLQGWLSVDNKKESCWAGTCKARLTDSTGSLTAVFKLGEGKNKMVPFEEPYYDQPLIVFDHNGQKVDPGWVSLTGTTHSIYHVSTNSKECQLIVYEVEAGN